MKFGKIAGVLSSILLSFAILAISVIRGATPRYAFSNITPSPLPESINKDVSVDYQMPYPGKIIPGNFLWYLKAFRDRVYYFLSPSSEKKAIQSLLYADKRILMSQTLFEETKIDLGYKTLEKSQKYLENTLKEDITNPEVLGNIALSSLKHREIIENKIMPLTPEDLRPKVIKLIDYSKHTYKESSEMLRKQGREAPINPFVSD